MIKPIYVLLVFVLVVMGCQNEDKVASEVNKIKLDVKVSRFDEEFAKASPADIPSLRKDYPYLFPAPDSVWVAKLKDSLQIELRRILIRNWSISNCFSSILNITFRSFRPHE